jgi:C1A family cysteine protease
MSKYGYLPSTDLSKYQKFSSSGLIKTASNTGEYILPEYTPISNQGGLSSCVGNATADALELMIGIENPSKVVQLSRLFNYYCARAITNDQNNDIGTYITSAFTVLKTIGIAPENEWQYIESNVNIRPPINAFKTAYDNRISDFYHIEEGPDKLAHIENAVRNNRPVVFAVQVSQSFENCFGVGKDYVFQKPTANLVGGHCMLVVGVRRNPELQFLLRNSWSSSWGHNGHIWITKEYMETAMDCWAPYRSPDLMF